MTVAAPPAEDQKLVRIAELAVATCRPPGEPVERFTAGVLTPLREWCAARADRVQAAYITPPKDGTFWVYVIARRNRDYDLGDEAADLTHPLRDAGWKVFVGALPPTTDEGGHLIFFDPATALLAHADR